MDNTIIAAVLAAGLTAGGKGVKDCKKAIEVYHAVFAGLEAQEEQHKQAEAEARKEKRAKRGPTPQRAARSGFSHGPASKRGKA